MTGRPYIHPLNGFGEWILFVLVCAGVIAYGMAQPDEPEPEHPWNPSLVSAPHDWHPEVMEPH